jgi:chromosome segregation ATPase
MLTLTEVAVLLVANGSLMLAFMAITLHYSRQEMLSAVRLCMRETKSMRSSRDECTREHSDPHSLRQSDLHSLRNDFQSLRDDFRSLQDEATRVAEHNSTHVVTELTETQNRLDHLASLVHQTVQNVYSLQTAFTQMERSLTTIEDSVGIESYANDGPFLFDVVPAAA